MTTWWAALRGWRERRTVNRRPIPDALWALTLARFPFLALPVPDEAAELRRLATLFLAQKEFHGAHGHVVTDDMAVAIAAQACLPVLHLGLDAYAGFVGIVVHADEVVARREVVDEDGVVHHYDEPLAGEAMEGGPLMLSWHDVAQAGETAEWGYNVVIHEFCHVLDMNDGNADGVPPMPTREMRARWLETLQRAYDAFCDAVERGDETLLDPYGAEAPSEFFAVACEVFFVAPHDLLFAHAPVYALLRDYFRQDPAARH
jgi:Mlc titration factor MtfA (ptsG expression regulator)